MIRMIRLFLVSISILFLSYGCGGMWNGWSTLSSPDITLTKIAGSWKYVGSGIIDGCGVSILGTIIINRDGTVSITEEQHSCQGDETSSYSGTINITPQGRAILVLPNGFIDTIQFSRDLSEAIFVNITNTDVFISGIAFRQYQ